MGSPVRGAVRLVRSAALAAVVLALSGGAHVLGGGDLPGGRVAAGLGAAVLALCWLLTRARLSAPLLLVVTGSGQVLAHHILATGAPQAMAGMPHMAGTAPAASLPAAGGAGGADVLMVGTHAAATIVLSLVLAAGEGALWRLRSWLAPLRAPAPRTPVVRPDTPAPRPASAPVRPRRWVLLVAVPRRGPPVVLAG